MAQQPIVRLQVERYRGVLSTELCKSEQQVLGKLLAECNTQLADLDRPIAERSFVPVAPIGEAVRATDGTYHAAERDLLKQRIGELQEGLEHLQRLTELGEVVSALLHEVIQPLAAISNYVAACQRLLPPGERQQIAYGLKQVAAQTDRAWQIVERVREFVK